MEFRAKRRSDNGVVVGRIPGETVEEAVTRLKDVLTHEVGKGLPVEEYDVTVSPLPGQNIRRHLVIRHRRS